MKSTPTSTTRLNPRMNPAESPDTEGDGDYTLVSHSAVISTHAGCSCCSR